mgnify:CR=1 FL=1
MLKAGIGMERLSKEEYLENPCGYASIPYWKAKKVCVSEEMRIVHNSAYDRRKYAAYSDEPYFRLLHPLKKPCAPVLPQGYSCGAATLREFAEHINRCYGGACVSEEKLRDYTARPVYDERLWLAVRNDRTGELAATGIAELDREIAFWNGFRGQRTAAGADWDAISCPNCCGECAGGRCLLRFRASAITQVNRNDCIAVAGLLGTMCGMF